MKFQHCRNCGASTGFKRHFGVGTILGVIFTGGLLFLALQCGGSSTDMRTETEQKRVTKRAARRNM